MPDFSNIDKRGLRADIVIKDKQTTFIIRLLSIIIYHQTFIIFKYIC